MENSNNKLIVYRRWLVKGRCNLSAHKPILISDSGTVEIAINNSKLLQPITELKDIY